MINILFYIVEIDNDDFNVISRHTDISHAAYRMQTEIVEAGEGNCARYVTILVVENFKTREITDVEKNLVKDLTGISIDLVNSKIELPDLSTLTIIIKADTAIASLETAIASWPDASIEQMINTVTTMEELDRVTDEAIEKSDDWITPEIESRIDKLYSLIQTMDLMSLHGQEDDPFLTSSPDVMMKGIENVIQTVENTRNSKNPEEKRVACSAMGFLGEMVEKINQRKTQINSDEFTHYTRVVNRISEYMDTITT